MTKAIAIFASLDTKGEEVSYVKELIAKRGHKVIVVDTGVLGRVPFPPDITRDQVAEAAGTSLNEVIALANEGKAMAAMAQGAAKVAQELYSSGKLDGVFALGGSMGTSVCGGDEGVAIGDAQALSVYGGSYPHDFPGRGGQRPHRNAPGG